jgi:hypothetical protein
MTTPHEPGAPHYEPPDVMEARLIEEIVEVQAQLGPESAQALRAASTEMLGRQSDRYENLAHLYRQLAIRRAPRPRSSS